MKNKLKNVAVIGQGFVGLPTAIAVANAKDKYGNYLFNVAGIEQDNLRGRFLKKTINEGFLPIKCKDKKIYQKF